MPSASSATSRNLLAHPPFLLYFLARGFSSFAYQIAAVAVGWQVYGLTNSAFALGMVGLVQFLPTALLVLVAGHAADRFHRQRVVQVCQFVEGLAAAYLAWGSYRGWLNVPEIFAAVTVLGTARAFEAPASSALLTGVTPEGMLQKGTAVASAAFQVAVISGPALGGLTYALGPAVPYGLMTVFWSVGAILNGAIRLDRAVTGREPPTRAAVFAGVKFVRNNPEMLGAISLDLFAVLLGGATALMPIYARDILHTGPWGLGVLRGAPAVGALLMTGFLARHSIRRRIGMRMFQAVVIFGVATVVFALSHLIWLSLVALTTMGAADMVSVVIRVSLVQLRTPDEMRGRVGAVNFLFINASNQLGEFESGITAAAFGAVPAAVLGGVGTVAVALLWMRLFPTLKEIERLE